MNNVTQKVWGWSTALVVDPLCEVHRIDVRPTGRCSVHQHDRKHNVFTLLQGVLHIYIWDQPGADLEDKDTARLVVLDANGETVDVPPTVPHQFYAPSYARAIETYYPASVKPEDIFRFNDLGGTDD